MSVRITDSCICCGACIDECPVQAIVDEDDNPEGNDIYYVYKDKCVECYSSHEVPPCADSCPTEGCFVWGELRVEFQSKSRGKEGEPVIS